MMIVSECVSMCIYDTWRALDLLEPEAEGIVSQAVWVLGTELEKRASSLNY